MNEVDKISSKSLEIASGDDRWDKLINEPFTAGTQAESPAAAESLDHSDKVSSLQTTESDIVAESYRPIGEMERPEIAREYMNLLHDLSDNFTSPEAVNSAVVMEDGTVRDRRGYSGDGAFIRNFYRRNGLELDESNNLDELRENGQNALAELRYENPDLDRAHTLSIVDSILDGEQEWRDAGEEYAKIQATLADATENLGKIQNERKSKGFFDRVATTLSFLQQTKEINKTIATIQEDLSRAERKSRDGNRTLAGSLEVAYSEDYHYGHHRFNYQHENDPEYKEQINEDYNNKFFGADDPIRQEKVNRALALRRALGEG